MTFFGDTEHFSGRIGALRWSILVGKQKHNVQKSIEAFCLRMLRGALLMRKTAGMRRAEETMAIFARNRSWDNSGLFSFCAL